MATKWFRYGTSRWSSRGWGIEIHLFDTSEATGFEDEMFTRELVELLKEGLAKRFPERKFYVGRVRRSTMVDNTDILVDPNTGLNDGWR